MRSLRSWVVGTCLAAICVASGCGDSDGSAPETDAGEDATVDADAAPPEDATVVEDAAGGEDGSVDGLECGDETCGDGEQCCLAQLEESCIALEDPCDGMSVTCQEPADCNEGDVCCRDQREGETSCVAPDDCDGSTVCVTEEDCVDDRNECCPPGICIRIC